MYLVNSMVYQNRRVRARVLEVGRVEEGLPEGRQNRLVHPKTPRDHLESQHLNPRKWDQDRLVNRGLLRSENHEVLLHINLQAGHLQKTEVIRQRALHLKKGQGQTVDHLKDPKVLQGEVNLTKSKVVFVVVY